MKTLFFLRHAKSSWDAPADRDFDRPLNKRGRRAAKAMAHYFSRHRLRPEMVLCSPAERTRQTLDLLGPALGGAQVVFDARIYEATRQTLFDCVRTLPDGAACALVIGHNPGLERVVQWLAGESDTPGLALLREKYPTGALSELASPVDHWSALAPGSCRLERFIRPSDLEE